MGARSCHRPAGGRRPPEPRSRRCRAPRSLHRPAPCPSWCRRWRGGGRAHHSTPSKARKARPRAGSRPAGVVRPRQEQRRSTVAVLAELRGFPGGAPAPPAAAPASCPSHVTTCGLPGRHAASTGSGGRWLAPGRGRACSPRSPPGWARRNDGQVSPARCGGDAPAGYAFPDRCRRARTGPGRPWHRHRPVAGAGGRGKDAARNEAVATLLEDMRDAVAVARRAGVEPLGTCATPSPSPACWPSWAGDGRRPGRGGALEEARWRRRHGLESGGVSVSRSAPSASTSPRARCGRPRRRAPCSVRTPRCSCSVSPCCRSQWRCAPGAGSCCSGSVPVTAPASAAPSPPP